MTRQKRQYAKKIAKEYDLIFIDDFFYLTVYHGNRESVFCYDKLEKKYVNICLSQTSVVNLGLAISKIPSRKAFTLYREDPDECLFEYVDERHDYYNDLKDIMIY